jgi:hypothetical protein
MDTAQLITADSVIIKRRQVHFNNLLALGLASLEIGEHRAAVKYLQQCYQLMQKAGEVMQQQQQAQKEQRTTAIAVLKQSLIVKYPPMQTIHLYL